MNALELIHRYDGEGTKLEFAPNHQALEALLDNLLPTFSYEEIGFPEVDDYEAYTHREHTDKKYSCIYHLVFTKDKMILWWWGERQALISALPDFCLNPRLPATKRPIFLPAHYPTTKHNIQLLIQAIKKHLHAEDQQDVEMSIPKNKEEYVDTETITIASDQLEEKYFAHSKPKKSVYPNIYAKHVMKLSSGKQSTTLYTTTENHQRYYGQLAAIEQRTPPSITKSEEE